MNEHVNPSAETLGRAARDAFDDIPLNANLDRPAIDEVIGNAILTLLPGRTEAEVKAEALREAAEIAVTSERGIPWDDDYDRATVAAWLDELADELDPSHA